MFVMDLILTWFLDKIAGMLITPVNTQKQISANAGNVLPEG